ncbi:transcription factor FapR [Halanaerobacter jeridensis]|uniref:Acyl-coenzyme A thioesterase PaaI-like protein n=1 Tax=Halanaerobacter jeridensis TaxID=706427 RepID=A0A938XUJ9_9FIRM|nr:transcription factor FapR [Halanaerobacter jeridensis]MBM7556586.1 acyl-coenzyme A thioesterase PaaI-like protein [Halanaerobacter jeridensis]
MKNLNKEERQEKLAQLLADDPFLTDKKLADKFGVSIQTIRLDRRELEIPEARKRIKSVARQTYSKVKSVQSREIIGELVEIELNKFGSSVLETTADMVLEKAEIVRGHHIFAQANSLAVAIIDTDVAVTGSANIRYQQPVSLGERLLATAEVQSIEDNKFTIEVTTKVNDKMIFQGEFVVFALEEEEIREGGR